MRIRMLLLSSFLLITACSHSDNTGNEPEEEQTQEETMSNPEENENTKEQKLIEKLPQNAETDDWNLTLVNPWNSISQEEIPELTEVDNDQQIDKRIKDDWDAWKEAASQEGHRLFLASGYRTIERQENNFNNKIQEYLDEGLSESEAKDKAKEYLTEPGHSEHHTGLALDIVDEEWIVDGKGLEPEFDTQDSQQWLVQTMADYGFILRYPKDKEEITGILYESWHFRYVGEENARFIVDNNLTLEEYIELLNIRDESENMD